MRTLITIIQEHIENRWQIIKLAKNDIIRTYRGSAFGWAWALIRPAITIFVFWFAFEIGLRGGGSTKENPFMWFACGIIPWFYIRDMLQGGTRSIGKYGYLVTKMKFPISTITTFVSISKIMINMVIISVMIIIFWIQGYPPTIYYLQIPFYYMCAFMFFTSFALFASPLAVISKDFGNLIRSFVMAVFWFSGIMWDPSIISVGWLKRSLQVNPVTFICSGFRESLIDGVWFFDPSRYQRSMFFIILLFIVVALALHVHKRTRQEIPDLL